ncbi:MULTISPECIES: enoyl-CoA hydratase/isomerase family protein [Bacillaceae]|uniref:enoyl-CoA hydratase/isomerase family protein n=1 Tax=Bacillaceae TaxID=186817 RepID=UPI000C7746C4|nr:MULTISPECIES: enoyl-CoA hydratase/isomerase family protein [Bacillaceae]PLR69638.1 enoyl-CoA hydratase [Bacillus sp. UMB0893]QNG58890.1 enoyl-CoA hydratase/isomerase family protein [Bacillus sp. PAMC26568]
MGKVLVNEQNGILEIKINRPERRNAVDFDVMNDLEAILDEAERNEKLLAATITGSGDKAFCAGGDLSVFGNLTTRQEAFYMLSKMGNLLYRFMTLHIPTYAIINGTAVGGGMEIAASADFRLVKEDAALGFIQGNQAITTGWGGSTMLFEKMQHDAALYMLTSGKKMTAAKAKELRFASKVFHTDAFDERAAEYIRQSLIPYPEVVRAYKEIKVNKWIESGLKKRMEEEISKCSELWISEAHLQAVHQFFQKRH